MAVLVLVVWILRIMLTQMSLLSDSGHEVIGSQNQVILDIELGVNTGSLLI